ncbi:MAG: nuclear transport factor 2 family protein [Rikenellaceae bacterium]
MKTKKEMVSELLKSIETGEKGAVGYINSQRYIQHNLMSGDGVEGFAAVLEGLADYPESPRVDTVRIFEDGDFVFTHTSYNFYGDRVGFDIFRFEDDLIVEHWDNMCEAVEKPNASGHTMIDGGTTIVDREDGEHNKPLIVRYISDVLIDGKLSELESYIYGNSYLEHNPYSGDGIDALRSMIVNSGIKYRTIHKVLGEGNFVLAVCEGYDMDENRLSIYDLYRLDDDKIVEHWGVTEVIPDRSEWKNDNGKFGFE